MKAILYGNRGRQRWRSGSNAMKPAVGILTSVAISPSAHRRVVTVVACVPSLDYRPATEEALGNYDSGRFVWVTENLRKLKKPVPWKGSQGFFVIPDNIIAEALA